MDTVVVIGSLWALILIGFMTAAVYRGSKHEVADKIGAAGVMGCCAWVCYHLIRSVL